MTKLREWEYLDNPKTIETDTQEIQTRQQDAFWADAAAHAAVECLGMSNSPTPLLDDAVEVEYTEVERSRRDGADRIYRYKTFELEVDNELQSLEQPYEWLTAEEIRDGRGPISPTVLEILGHQDVNRIVSAWQ